MPLLDDEEENQEQPDVFSNDFCKVSASFFLHVLFQTSNPTN